MTWGCCVKLDCWRRRSDAVPCCWPDASRRRDVSGSTTSRPIACHCQPRRPPAPSRSDTTHQLIQDAQLSQTRRARSVSSENSTCTATTKQATAERCGAVLPLKAETDRPTCRMSFLHPRTAPVSPVSRHGNDSQQRGIGFALANRLLGSRQSLLLDRYRLVFITYLSNRCRYLTFAWEREIGRGETSVVGWLPVVMKANCHLEAYSYYRALIGTHFDHLFYTSKTSTRHLALFV